MVAITFTPEYNYRIGMKYFTVSVAVNIVLVLTVQIGTIAPVMVQALPMLKVNLMALAAPTVIPIEKITQKLNPTPVIKNKIMRDINAEKLFTKTATLTPVLTPKRVKQSSVSSTLSAANNRRGNDKSTVVHEAQYRRQTPPIYPHRAAELGQQGTVTLYAEILPSGYPRELKIVESSGYRLLDKAAVVAVKKWEFEPTTINGNIVTSWARVPVKFIIK